MRKVLVCQVASNISSPLKEEMKNYGWMVDACDGLLEMLRLLEDNEYELVVLGMTPRNVEIHTRIGAIKALDKHPKIILNLDEPGKFSPSSVMLEYPVIKGALNTQKLLQAAQGSVS